MPGLRADLRNQIICGKLIALRAKMSEARPPQARAALFEEGKWVWTAPFDESGHQIVAEPTSPGPDLSGNSDSSAEEAPESSESSAPG